MENDASGDEYEDDLEAEEEAGEVEVHTNREVGDGRARVLSCCALFVGKRAPWCVRSSL